VMDSFVVHVDELATAAVTFDAQSGALSDSAARINPHNADCGEQSLSALLAVTVHAAQFLTADLSGALSRHASNLRACLSDYIASDQAAAAQLNALIDDGASR
jgi:hypothetical protein